MTAHFYLRERLRDRGRSIALAQCPCAAKTDGAFLGASFFGEVLLPTGWRLADERSNGDTRPLPCPGCRSCA